MKKLVTLFVSVFMFTLIAGAKSKNQKVSKYRAKIIKKDAKLGKAKRSIVYDKIWFASLTSKQQDIYLDKLAKLAVKASRSKSYSSTGFDFLIEMLVPKADAKINNGLVYDSKNYADALRDINLGPLTPTCPSGENPCAVAMGLVTDASGNEKVACSPNSTPTCFARGDRNLLKRKLNACERSDSDVCKVLNNQMSEETKKMNEDYCEPRKNSSDRPTAIACTDLLKALGDSGASKPPVIADAPTGENCDKVANELVKRKEASRSPSASTAHYSNNEFWRSMITLAKNSCGGGSITAKTQVTGVCNVANMAGATMTVPKASTVKVGLVGGARALQKCVDDFVRKETANLNQRKTWATQFQSQASGMSSLQIQNEVKRLRAIPIKGRDTKTKYKLIYFSSDSAKRANWVNTINKQIANVSTQAAAKQASGQCSSVARVSVSGNGESLSPDAISSIMTKFKNDKSLSDEELNQFKAATGLNPSQFRKTFCDSRDHKDFKKNLRDAVNYPKPVRADMRAGSNQVLAKQAKAALFKMKKCLAEVVSVEESDCGYVDIEDANAIRNATNSSPLLAKDKTTGKCMLVVGHEYEEQTSKIRDKSGNLLKKRASRITLDNLTSGKTVDEEPAGFARGYFLKAYRCKNESVPRATYRDVKGDPESEDGVGVTSEI